MTKEDKEKIIGRLAIELGEVNQKLALHLQEATQLSVTLEHVNRALISTLDPSNPIPQGDFSIDGERPKRVLGEISRLTEEKARLKDQLAKCGVIL